MALPKFEYVGDVTTADTEDLCQKSPLSLDNQHVYILCQRGMDAVNYRPHILSMLSQVLKRSLHL